MAEKFHGGGENVNDNARKESSAFTETLREVNAQMLTYPLKNNDDLDTDEN